MLNTNKNTTLLDELIESISTSPIILAVIALIISAWQFSLIATLIGVFGFLITWITRCQALYLAGIFLIAIVLVLLSIKIAHVFPIDIVYQNRLLIFALLMGGEMNKKRPNFSGIEKFRIALEAIKAELTIAEISAKYRVHATQINKWKRQALDYLATAFAGKLKLPEQDEDKFAELYQQIGQLKVENDFLKKKCDLFKR
jgi:transposase